MSWEDVSLGQRAAPEDHRKRVHMNAYWQETCEMFEAGWEHFWSKLHRDEAGNWRHLEPPVVGKEILESDYVFDNGTYNNVFPDRIIKARKL